MYVGIELSDVARNLLMYRISGSEHGQNHVRNYTHTHTHIHTHARTHARTQIHMYTDMRTRMRTRTRSQSHAHTGVTHNYRHTLRAINISTNRLHLGCFFIVDKLVTYITVCRAHGAGGIGRKKSPLILNRHKSDAANLRRQTRR